MPARTTRPDPRASSSRMSDAKGKPEHEILFQQFFKSVGPRTYAAQVKRAGNGNHYIVLTEGQRDEKTDQIRKTRLFVFSEDFVEFFKLVKATAEYVKANPVSPEVKRKREAFWAKQGRAGGHARSDAHAASAKTSPEPAGDGGIARAGASGAARDAGR